MSSVQLYWFFIRSVETSYHRTRRTQILFSSRRVREGAAALIPAGPFGQAGRKLLAQGQGAGFDLGRVPDILPVRADQDVPVPRAEVHGLLAVEGAGFMDGVGADGAALVPGNQDQAGIEDLVHRRGLLVQPDPVVREGEDVDLPDLVGPALPEGILDIRNMLKKK